MPAILTRRLLATACLILVGLTACAPRQPPAQMRRPVVTVSIPPQRFLAERIGGDVFKVNVMVGPGESPATYEPRPSQLAALRTSSVYFAIGVPFEQAWLPRFTAAHPGLRVEDTVAGIERVPLDPSHEHAGHAGHAHGLDPHVWLDPALMKEMAVVYRDTFRDLVPGQAAVFDANLEAFRREADALDQALRETLARASRKTFMVFHPSWGYFARAYGLEMLAIERGGQEPSASEVADLIETARARDVGVMLVQPEFNTAAAESIARQSGARLVLVSPLDADWPALLRRVAAALAEPSAEGRP